MTLRFLIAAGVLLLAACAGPWGAMRVPVGASRDDVIASAGQPTAVVPLPNGGQRLQYTLQPLGREAYMVDLDPAGRVVSARQVLDEADFERIQPGAWNVADVQREFGPPAQIDGVASWNGPVWTYRWRDTVNNLMFYYVYFDPQGIVRRAHPAMEFINGPNNDHS
jgi:hypothetical protein